MYQLLPLTIIVCGWRWRKGLIFSNVNEPVPKWKSDMGDSTVKQFLKVLLAVECVPMPGKSVNRYTLSNYVLAVTAIKKLTDQGCLQQRLGPCSQQRSTHLQPRQLLQAERWRPQTVLA